MKTRLLEPVRRLLADAAADLLERGEGSLPSRRETRLVQAQAVLRDQLGLLHVERHRTAKDIEAANAELSASIANAASAFHQAGLEERLSELRETHTAISAEIGILERAAAALADAATPGARDPHHIAARLADLERLLQSDPGGPTP